MRWASPSQHRTYSSPLVAAAQHREEWFQQQLGLAHGQLYCCCGGPTPPLSILNTWPSVSHSVNTGFLPHTDYVCGCVPPVHPHVLGPVLVKLGVLSITQSRFTSLQQHSITESGLVLRTVSAGPAESACHAASCAVAVVGRALPSSHTTSVAHRVAQCGAQPIVPTGHSKQLFSQQDRLSKTLV